MLIHLCRRFSETYFRFKISVFFTEISYPVLIVNDVVTHQIQINSVLPKGILTYVTTAGGPYDPAYSYGYVENLAKNFFGIPETQLIKAEMLDVEGYNAEEILEKAIMQVKNLIQQ